MTWWDHFTPTTNPLPPPRLPPVSSTVDLVIMQTVCALENGLESTDPSDYVLRVCGAAEYLTAESALHDYQYVQRCIKYEEDVRLSLIHTEQLTLPLQRTVGRGRRRESGGGWVQNSSHCRSRGRWVEGGEGEGRRMGTEQLTLPLQRTVGRGRRRESGGGWKGSTIIHPEVVAAHTDTFSHRECDTFSVLSYVCMVRGLEGNLKSLHSR